MKIRELIAIIERSEKEPLILSTLKGILRMHGETVNVESLADDGFEWTIPI